MTFTHSETSKQSFYLYTAVSLSVKRLNEPDCNEFIAPLAFQTKHKFLSSTTIVGEFVYSDIIRSNRLRAVYQKETQAYFCAEQVWH